MKKILLIEDDLPLVRMYQIVFENTGLSFLEAIDGEEGLQKAREDKPDLILLDLVIPKKDGFEVLKELKSDKATSKIPVFCLTVLGQKEDVEKAKHLGSEDYLIKTEVMPSDVVSRVLLRLNVS